MDTLFLISIVLFLAMLLLSDILVVRRILRKEYDSAQKMIYILLVLLLPVIGMSIYFMIDRRR